MRKTHTNFVFIALAMVHTSYMTEGLNFGNPVQRGEAAPATPETADRLLAKVIVDPEHGEMYPFREANEKEIAAYLKANPSVAAQLGGDITSGPLESPVAEVSETLAEPKVDAEDTDPARTDTSGEAAVGEASPGDAAGTASTGRRARANKAA